MRMALRKPQHREIDLRRALAVIALALLGSTAAQAAARIVTLAPHLAELVCAAGGCERLVGVSARSDYPPSVLKLPQIGDAFAVNLEVILNLHPDLVLAWDGGTPPDTIARLRGLGLPVQAVAARGLDGVGDSLETVGGWIGTASVAQAAAQAYRARLAAQRQRWHGAAPIRVVYQIETAPAYTINGASPISEAIAVCGGINVFAALPTLAAPVSPESMLAARPDVVLYGGEDNQSAVRAYWQRLKGSTAQRNDTLYAINADWLARATPRLLDGVDEVCAKLDDARRRIATTGAEHLR
ncbi:MAG: cobalamin-binding protein [Nevskia sp.]|nr:cobalamin-binding protein [Nevskia sp.]